eukprot:749343-Hanusia_phi.AAC.8
MMKQGPARDGSLRSGSDRHCGTCRFSGLEPSELGIKTSKPRWVLAAIRPCRDMAAPLRDNNRNY